jgi:hypothetical protein
MEQGERSRWSYRFHELRGEIRAYNRIIEKLDRELVAAAAVANGIAPENSQALRDLIAQEIDELRKDE